MNPEGVGVQFGSVTISHTPAGVRLLRNTAHPDFDRDRDRDIRAVNHVLNGEAEADALSSFGSTPLLSTIRPEGAEMTLHKMVKFVNTGSQREILWRYCLAHTMRLQRMNLDDAEGEFNQLVLKLSPTYAGLSRRNQILSTGSTGLHAMEDPRTTSYGNAPRLFDQPAAYSQPVHSRSSYSSATQSGRQPNQWPQTLPSFPSHNRPPGDQPGSVPRGPLPYGGYQYTLGNEPNVMPHSSFTTQPSGISASPSMTMPNSDLTFQNNSYFYHTAHQGQPVPTVPAQHFRQGHMPQLMGTASYPSQPADPVYSPCPVPDMHTPPFQHSDASRQPHRTPQSYPQINPPVSHPNTMYGGPGANGQRPPPLHYAYNEAADMASLTMNFGDSTRSQRRPSQGFPSTGSHASLSSVRDPIYDPYAAYLREQRRDNSVDPSHEQDEQAFKTRAPSAAPEQTEQKIPQPAPTQPAKPIEAPTPQSTQYHSTPPPARVPTPFIPPETSAIPEPPPEDATPPAPISDEQLERRRADLRKDLAKELAAGSDLLSYRLRELNELFPLQPGEQTERFNRGLLANRPIAEGDNSESARAVQYAKAHWWHYYQDSDVYRVIAKMRAEEIETPQERVRREFRSGGHLYNPDEMWIVRQVLPLSDSQM